MIGNAKKSIVLSTFDLRPDHSGMKIIAALYTAAERGVQVQILIDGIYQKLFLEKRPIVMLLCFVLSTQYSGIGGGWQE